MFAYVQNEIRMGTKSGYDTFMFVYTTHPLKAVFLKDSLTFQPWYGWNSADQTGLKLTRDLPASAFQVIGLRVCTVIPG